MKRLSKRKSYAVLLTALTGASVTHAATNSLTGSTTVNGAISLDTPANWSLGRVPITTDEAEIPSGYATANYNMGFGSNQSFGDFIVNNNAPLVIGDLATANASSSAYTLTLSGGAGSTQAIADGGASGDLILIGSSVTSGTNVSIGSNVYNTSNTASTLKLALGTNGNFDVANSGVTASISSVISGSYAITKTGAGTLILNGDPSNVAKNTFTGELAISAGVVQVDSTYELGSLGAIINAGALRVAFPGSGSSYYSTGRSFSLNSTSSAIDVPGGSYDALELTGANALTGTGTLNVNASSTTDTGTLLLYNNSNGYSGGTVIDRGTLYVETVSPGTATPAGTGNISIGAATLRLGLYTYTFANPIILTDPASAISINNTLAGYLTGGVTGTGTLNSTGLGTVYLPTYNTYSGGTNISSGIVDVAKSANASNTALGTGNVAIGAGTLQFHVSGYYNSSGTVVNAISLNNALSAIESGDTTNNDYFYLTGAISGTGTLNKTGIGKLYINPTTGTNTYSGGTNISSGLVDFQTIRGLPTLSTNAGPITMANGTTFEYDGSGGLTNTLNTFNISGVSTLNITGSLSSYGVISGTGQLVKKGSSVLSVISETPGTTILTSNTYTGGTNISAGTLQFYGVSYEVPASGTVLIESGAAFQFYNTSASGLSQTLPAVPFLLTDTTTGGNTTISTFANSNTSGFTLTLPGQVSGYGTLLKNGAAALVLNNSTNNYSGGTLVNAGSLIGTVPGAFGTGNLTITPNMTTATVGDNVLVSSNGSIGSTAVVTVSSETTDSGFGIGTLQLNSAAPTIASLAGNGVVVLNNNTSGTALTISGGAATAFSGTISEGTVPGSLTQAGPATLTLSGINNYSGGTNVTGGTLLIGSATALSPLSIVNVSGGTLDVSGFNTSVPALTVGASGTLNIGLGNVMAVTGVATFGGTLNISSGTAGTLPENLITYGSDSGTFTTVTNIPSGDTLLYTATALELITNGPANLTYLNNGGAWDVATSPSFNGSSGPTVFHTLDNVTFDDSYPTGSYNVPVTAVVSPGSTTFNNSSGNYNLSGSGSISGGGGLLKLGTGTVTMSISNSYTGPTNISSGKLVLNAAGALPSGTNLIIGSSGVVVANNLGSPTGLAVSALSLSGKLDLNNNALVIHGGSLTTIAPLIQSSFNSGWNASSGITSTTAANDTTHLTALAVIQNSSNGSSGGTVLHSTLDGLTGLTASDVLVKYTYYGDTDLSGTVDGSDYSRIDSAYEQDQTYLAANPTGTALPATGWFNGDFNYDGVVDGSDYTLIDNAFNSQSTVYSSEIASPLATATAEIAGTSSVPEPTTLGLIGVSVLGLLGRRRRD